MRFSWLFEKTSLLRSVFANQLGDGTDSSVKQVAIIGELNQKPTTRLANRYFVSTCLYLPTYLAHPIQPPKDQSSGLNVARAGGSCTLITLCIRQPGWT